VGAFWGVIFVGVMLVVTSELRMQNEAIAEAAVTTPAGTAPAVAEPVAPAPVVVPAPKPAPVEDVANGASAADDANIVAPAPAPAPDVRGPEPAAAPEPAAVPEPAPVPEPAAAPEPPLPAASDSTDGAANDAPAPAPAPAPPEAVASAPAQPSKPMLIEDIPALRAELAEAPAAQAAPEGALAEAPVPEAVPSVADAPVPPETPAATAPAAVPTPEPDAIAPTADVAAAEVAALPEVADETLAEPVTVADSAAPPAVQAESPVAEVQATAPDDPVAEIATVQADGGASAGNSATGAPQETLAGTLQDVPVTPGASTLAPVGTLAGRDVPGVVVLRSGSGTDAVVAAPDAPAAVVPVDDLPPLQRYASAFENPDNKPVFAIVLIDTGIDATTRAALADLPFAVTVALDPLDADAPEAAKAYRAAGREVVMLATAIPQGATASDIEVTFAAHATALPETVAVLDLESGGFQNNRPLATLVAPLLKAQGRGLVTWDAGLNAGDQVARREGLAAGLVFRRIDPAGSDRAAIRRTLDRAVFRAAQDGRTIVVGDSTPETLATLLEWSIEGRGSEVALAPVTAALAVAE
jgi:uncharacterized protein